MPLTQALRIHELSPAELAVYRTLDPDRVPQHVAIIMDGNGRWAGKRAMKRFLGHQQGAESVHFVVETASRINLPFLTLYAFSLENNLRRPKAEVGFLMKLLRNYLVGNVKRMNDNNVRMAYIGRTQELPPEVQETMRWAEAETAKNTGTTLTLALNYGSRAEIVDATRDLLRELMAEAHRRGCSVEDLLSRRVQLFIAAFRYSRQQVSGRLMQGRRGTFHALRSGLDERVCQVAEATVRDVSCADWRGCFLV